MAKEENKTVEVFTLPVGRVINQSLFVKDQFNDAATPSYKVEVAIDAGSKELEDIEDALFDFADDYFGAGNYNEDKLILPFKSGDKMAKKREDKGKEGDAYRGKTVIRANTIYNKDGQDGPGGIQVYDEEVELIDGARSSEVYNGCLGQAAVTIAGYMKQVTDAEGETTEFPALKFYLSAFQKTGDGEKLVTAADRSSLFKPTGRSGGGESGGRRRRNRS